MFTSGYVNTETILHFFSIFHTNIEYVNKRLEKVFLQYFSLYHLWEVVLKSFKAYLFPYLTIIEICTSNHFQQLALFKISQILLLSMKKYWFPSTRSRSMSHFNQVLFYPLACHYTRVSSLKNFVWFLSKRFCVLIVPYKQERGCSVISLTSHD